MTKQFHKNPGKNSIQFKIGFLMVVAVILLSATCYLLYRNLSSIVSSIRIDVDPELRLLSIRDISMDLEKAGNSVRIYTITGNPSDIKPYYKIISNIDEKVIKLRSECRNDSALLQQTDTISRLIEENIIIWNQLLVLNKDNRVIENLRQLSDQYNVASESNQKRGILKRVFSRKPESLPDEQEIIANINEVARQDSTTKDELIEQESQLAINSSEITRKFYDLISKMEDDVYEHIKVKADLASQVAGKTYRLLIMLAISGGLLALLVLYIIIRYVRNAYAYQIALEKSKEEAEKLSRTKELFMANISHEIRTPVTAISGFTEQLLHETYNDNTTRSLKIIKSSSDHLLKIIDDILDFSKLQNNKLVLEKVHFSIGQILGDVHALFEKQAQHNNTRLSYSLSADTPQVLLGDPFRLKQIIINLVSNSVKFTKDGEVNFAISCVRKQNEELDLMMEFTDTGIGIEESKIDIIFEDFTQAEMSTTRKYGGTGLGLSIVKRLIELHHGTIDFKSKKNQGTKVVCRIPYLAGDDKQLRKNISHPVSIPEEILRLKFLVVDDEEYNRLLFKKIFDRWNVRYHELGNGMEALEALKDERYDFLFLDMRMPGIDGLKTTRFIREELKISESDMPVVIVSAAPLDEEWQKYRKEGINAFLQKPFTEDMLMTTILAVVSDIDQIILPGPGNSEFEKPDAKHKIDLQNLYQLAAGDELFVKQMLTTFITTTDKLMKEMKEAAGELRWESVADISHKILPPCRHIGAIDLCDLLTKIEKAARNHDFTLSVGSLTEDAFNEFADVSNLLNEQIAKMS